MKILIQSKTDPSLAFNDAVMAHINTCTEDCTFDKLREHLGETVETLPDGYIHQICINNGLDVSFD